LCGSFKKEIFDPGQIILGRDFAGTIVAVGEGVKNFKSGQEVMGFIPPPFQGSHAQYVIVSVSDRSSCQNCKKINHVSKKFGKIFFV